MQPEEMLTASEASTAFRNAGLSETTFRSRIKAGIIEKHLPEGRKRGALYPKAQVLAAIEQATKGKIKKPKRPRPVLKTSTFLKATIQDMPDIAELLRTFYSKISVEKRSAWLERNPDIAYILRSEGKVVGCSFLMPLTEQKIHTILSSKWKPPTRSDEIFLYEPGLSVHLYMRSTGVLQSVSREQRRHWAVRFIIGLSNVLKELGAKGVIVEKIYAQVETKEAEHTLKLLGFLKTPIISEANTHWSNFVLDIPASGDWVAKKYKDAFAAWLAQNAEE